MTKYRALTGYGLFILETLMLVVGTTEKNHHKWAFHNNLKRNRNWLFHKSKFYST